MHYTIDGYNLLFHLFGPSPQNFTLQREQLIHELSDKIEFLALNITIVFDSQYLGSEGSRSHFKHLEIVFTSEGVTADDYIIKSLGTARDIAKETLVTNDRELTQRARTLTATTQRIEHFLNWLDRRYSNIKRGKAKSTQRIKVAAIPPSPPAKEIKPKEVPPPPKVRPKLIELPKPPSKKVEVDDEGEIIIPGSFEYYLTKFQAAHELILKEEKAAREARKLRNKENRKKKK